MPGHLGNVGDKDHENGLLSFLRLVGSAYLYFKKHISGFYHDKPDTLFFSLPKDASPLTRHVKWLEKIRETVWERVLREEHALPSFEALRLHWKRAIWVLKYWSKSKDHDISMSRKIITIFRKYVYLLFFFS